MAWSFKEMKTKSNLVNIKILIFVFTHHRHCQFDDVAGAKWHVLGQREWRDARFESSAAHSRTSRGESHHHHDYHCHNHYKDSNSFEQCPFPSVIILQWCFHLRLTLYPLIKINSGWQNQIKLSQVDGDNWLQFDARNQEFIGVPLENDVGRLDFKKYF